MNFEDYINVYEDFPKEGISFKDIFSLTLNPEVYQKVIDRFYELAKPLDANLIVATEARGFIFGCPLAYKMGLGLVPVRKPGKLPGEIASESYDLEYGSETLEIQKAAIKPGDRVIIVDDLIATGGTLQAMIKLIENLGGEIAGILSLIELTDFHVTDELLKDYNISTLVKYNS